MHQEELFTNSQLGIITKRPLSFTVDVPSGDFSFGVRGLNYADFPYIGISVRKLASKQKVGVLILKNFSTLASLYPKRWEVLFVRIITDNKISIKEGLAYDAEILYDFYDYFSLSTEYYLHYTLTDPTDFMNEHIELAF